MNTKKTDNSVKLAVAYCRVSTDREEQQKQWLEKFKETGSKHAQIGMLCHREIKRIGKNGKATRGKFVTEPRNDGLYVDEGISGKSIHNRRAFQQMIEDAMLRKFDMIYVEDVSRFSRSMEDGYTVVKNLRDIGVGVYFRKEGWDSLDLSKDFELQLRLSIAQEENRSKSARVKWSLDRLRQKGGWSSVPALGYDKVDGFLQINKEEAEIVKKVFDWFTNEHWGLAKIARKLNEMQAVTKRGGYWRTTQIGYIIRNELYTGKQVSHKIETYDITRKTQKEVDPSEWVTIQKEELRIISDELFALAQAEYNTHKGLYFNGSRQSSERLLSGLLYCAHCGSCLTRRKANYYVKKDGTITDRGYIWLCPLYRCYGKKQNGGMCNAEYFQVSEDECIKAIKYEIKQLKASNTDSMFKMYMSTKFNDIENMNKGELEKKSSDLNGEMRLLRQDKRDGLIDDDLYKDQMKELNREIGEVKASLSRMERLEEEKKHKMELYKRYQMAVQEVDVDNLDNATLKSLFYKIYVSCKRDSNGKKIPTLRFVYKFLDSTNDTILQSQNDKNMDVNSHIFTSIYAYREAEETDKGVEK
jgi:DNA invertase Pin-like site-specific DNA recombinase